MFRWTVFFLIPMALLCLRVAAQTSVTDVRNLTTTFAGDPRFAALKTTMENGFLVLRGSVESCEEKQKALKQAGDIEGLRGVEDHIEVKASGVTDRTLTREIGQELKGHNLRGTQFRVSKGIVTLRGRLRSESEREQAATLICGTPGVVYVNDEKLQILAKQAR